MVIISVLLRCIVNFTHKCFPHVMQCAAVKTQLGSISVPPQVGKKVSKETYKLIK